MNEKDNASFMLELDLAYPEIMTAKKYFGSLKIMNQWLKRNREYVFSLEERKYILTANGYERFHVFGNLVIPYSEISTIMEAISKSEKAKIEYIEEMKTRSIHSDNSEDPASSKE